MGRSQVKYRATHGRGRGRGAGGARGRGKGRGNATDGQALGSNAFRYEDRDDNAEGEEEEEEEMVFGQTKALASGQRQFFAEEKSYRGPTGGSHFQSRTMKQWEATEDDDAIDGTFGVVVRISCSGRGSCVILTVGDAMRHATSRISRGSLTNWPRCRRQFGTTWTPRTA